jgi:hypothetical protein
MVSTPVKGSQSALPGMGKPISALIQGGGTGSALVVPRKAGTKTKEAKQISCLVRMTHPSFFKKVKPTFTLSI